MSFFYKKMILRLEGRNEHGPDLEPDSVGFLLEPDNPNCHLL